MASPPTHRVRSHSGGSYRRCRFAIFMSLFWVCATLGRRCRWLERLRYPLSDNAAA